MGPQVVWSLGATSAGMGEGVRKRQLSPCVGILVNDNCCGVTASDEHQRTRCSAKLCTRTAPLLCNGGTVTFDGEARTLCRSQISECRPLSKPPKEGLQNQVSAPARTQRPCDGALESMFYNKTCGADSNGGKQTSLRALTGVGLEARQPGFESQLCVLEQVTCL